MLPETGSKLSLIQAKKMLFRLPGHVNQLEQSVVKFKLGVSWALAAGVPENLIPEF